MTIHSPSASPPSRRNKSATPLGDVLPAELVLSTLKAFRDGDFTQKLPLNFQGIGGEIAEAFNDVLELNRDLSSELAMASQIVGEEGRLQRRISMPYARGSWRTCVDSVNDLIGNLVQPTSEVGRVIGAVAAGDLSHKMALDIDGRPLKGEFLRAATVVNGMVEQLSSFASEVTRVAREVGTDGKLGGQANVRGVSGTWRDITDNVNVMARNLTDQVRNIAAVTTAVANGDLSKKVTVDVRGEILELKNTVNTMVDQLNSFAREVTRVAREVGTEGKLGGQAAVPGASGTWRDLTDNVNLMASNLTAQVRNIAEVTTAVARGDLSKKITVGVKGEILELKVTINTMVDQLNSFAREVTRVAREVGTEGKLGGQAEVSGVAGTWKDLTDGVNGMASNLTAQVRNIADVTTAVARGDLSSKITVDARGEIRALKETTNTMVDQLNAFANEVTRVAREVGTEGKLGGQARVPGVSGTWKDLTDSVNSMASNLTDQVRNIADVTTAVARGDLSKTITVDARGEISELKSTINTMVDQLNAFANEVTRVAREVGTEGKLGGQAKVLGVAGTWKDLTDNVNSMATNLTNQVRGIAKVVTAVARGDLTRKLALEASGEIAELADTINSMTDTLAIFAEQVVSVAREVGVEGKLGAQAKVPGAAGTWRDLTDNVNQLAANLTTQVRAIGDVATAVTKGDLTRHITVEASGEVAALKDNVNEMIRNLKGTTQKTTEQDWLKTNLARFTRMLQGQRDLRTVAQQILSELGPLVGVQQGAFYLAETEERQETRLNLLAGYAAGDEVATSFRLGQGLVGQCAFEKRTIVLVDPTQQNIRIRSGIGEAHARTLAILPVLFEGQVNAVIELASHEGLSDIHRVFLDQLTESIGIVVNTIAASTRTETLLRQSQSLTQELQTQQEELRQTNERLERQAATLRESEERLTLQQDELKTTNEQLEEKAKLLEVKNREVEYAKAEVEDKAEQLALTSKYKSEFLANMSHELRTPLNSLLILSRMLQENIDENLTTKQVEFAKTIHASGAELLGLINDILELSKIESGTLTLEPREMSLDDLRDYVEQNFKHIAEQRRLTFSVALHPGLPQSIVTDAKRLQQILKNLLSNAFKFTEKGSVTMQVQTVNSGWRRDHEALNEAETVVAFNVTDTGIGIPHDKQRAIFEAFQQADGTTSRRYGGTGLGLSISREIAHLLGGDLRVASEPGVGSTFTFYLSASFSSQDESSPLLSLSFDPLALDSAVELSAAPQVAERLSSPGTSEVIVIMDEMATHANTVLGATRELDIPSTLINPRSTFPRLSKPLPNVIVMDLEPYGWALLDTFKRDPTTRQIPILAMGDAKARQRALSTGAAGFLEHTAEPQELSSELQRLSNIPHRQACRILLSCEQHQRAELEGLLGGANVSFTCAEPSAQVLSDASLVQDIDLAVFDVRESSGGDFAAVKLWMDHGLTCPILILGADTAQEDEALARIDGPAVKFVSSRVTMLEWVTIYLHLHDSRLSPQQRDALPVRSDLILEGLKLLVIDDDVRNIFAMTSALERYGAEVVYAESGQGGLELLEREADIRAVLVDIMMPSMDGYEVIRRVRAEPRLSSLPVVAVTAKAMRGDCELCLAAGATDYVARPVDLDHLLLVLRARIGV